MRKINHSGAIDERRYTMKDSDTRCSFCKKSAGEVAQIAGGRNASICNECVALIAGVIAKRHKEWREKLIGALSAMD